VFRSLTSRLLLTYVLIIGIVLFMAGASLLYFLLRNPLAERQVYRNLDLIAASLDRRNEAAAFAEAAPARLKSALRRMDVLFAVRGFLLSPGGEVLADSRPDTLPPSEDILQALSAGGEAAHGEFRDDTGRRWLYRAEALQGGRVLVLAEPRPTLRAFSLLGVELTAPLLRAGAVSLLVSILLAWLVARWIALPLQHMAVVAKAVADGDFRQRMSPSGPQEAQSLAQAFNEMVQKVEGSRRTQRDFVANVSHELKTPLTSIQGFAQAILDGTAEDEQAKRHAARVIHEESDRLRRLVDELLDLARLDAGQVAFARDALDLRALLAAVVERLSLRAREKGVSIQSILSGLPTVIGDGDRLAQVFTNLLDNAIRYAPRDSAVVVRGETQDGWVTLHVDDRGPGIPPEELSRVFERFYQLEKSRRSGEGRGAGLGLAICREVVQAHGGRIVAQSAVGQGTRFSVQLPIVRPQDETLVRPRP